MPEKITLKQEFLDLLPSSKKGWKRLIIDYLFVALGTLLYAIGVTLFMQPYQLVTGGLAGVCLLINYSTGFPVQISYAFFNMLLLAIAAKIVGMRFCIRTLWGFGNVTLWLAVCQAIAADPVTGELPMLLHNQLLLATILGAICEGIGLSFCFFHNGSTGGIDIIAATVNKFKDISFGEALMLCDFIIVSCSYFLFHDVERVIFGYVLLVLANMTLDYRLRKMHQAVEFKIFSRNYSGVADAIIKKGFGVTVIDGKGWWTQWERKVVICICSKRYSQSIMHAIKSIDPYCFVSVTNVQNVYGEGFATMKTKIKNQKPVIVFATNNANKLREVRQMLEKTHEVRSLTDIGCNVEIPETHNTLEENALEKARFIKQYYGFDCFADDTGLECEGLEGKPGVYSARYATIADEGWEPTSQDHNSQQNMDKLLLMLNGRSRKAQFRTVIALIKDDREYTFEGIVKGEITTERHGTEGFGYDPVFKPEGYNKTFAEMSDTDKNSISHRGRAVAKLVDFLRKPY